MNIDPVAVYAAVVATAALGWQVYQWTSDRKGRSDERKGALELEVSTEWRDDDIKLLCVTFVNRNDYPVRLDVLMVGTSPTKAFLLKAGPGTYTGEITVMPAHQAGLPAVAVPPHDSLRHVWHAAELRKMLGDAEFRPGYTVAVEAINSLGHHYSASTEIEDSRRHYADN